MSLITITAAQRAELQGALAQAGLDLHKFAEDGRTPTTAEVTELADVLARALAALTAAGYSAAPTGSKVLTAGTNTLMAVTTSFTTARTAGASASVTINLTVANGVVTAAAIS